MNTASGDFIRLIGEVLDTNRHQNNAKAMEAYMKNNFAFFGIKKTERSQLTDSIVKTFCKENPTLIIETVKDLWSKDEREFQMIGLEMLALYKKHIQASDIDEFEYLIVEKSWWDTVDFVATHMAGAYFIRYPEATATRIDFWNKSGNIWLVRSAILFQLKYKKQTNRQLLFDLCKANAHDNEFFVAKAIGWALREYAKSFPDEVRQFVEQTNLQKLSKREALKNMN